MLSTTTGAAMVGRSVELSLLEETFARTREGTPAAVLIAGEAGIGKSRLLREFESAVAPRANVLVGRCIDLGATPTPYGPLVGILRGIVAEMGRGDAWEAAGPGREALPLVLPELADESEGRAEASPESLREAIANLVEACASRAPLVLIIEDLHWADESTLTILSFLLRVVQQARILLVMSFRTEEVGRGAAVHAFIGEAVRARLIERVDLQRLDATAGRELVERIRSAPLDDVALERLMVRSEGVPFFIEELACCVDGPLPDTLRDLLLARFELLGDDAKHVVRVVSGSDARLPHRLLAALAAQPDGRLDEAVREAVRAGILVVDGDDYGFRHALLREAVHDDLLPGERSRLHRAYAEAIEARVGGAGRRVQAALAHHWNAARDSRRALEAAVAAMQEAKESYAFATSARFGELALELWEQVPDAAQVAGVSRVTLLSRLGSILRNAGDAERSLVVVDAALAEIDPATAAASVYIRLLRDKANYLTNLGREGAIPLLVEALAVFDEHCADSGVDERLHASLLNTLAGRYMVGGQRHEGIVTATEAYRTAERAADESEMSIAANLRGACRVHLGDVDGALADFETARHYAAGSGALLRYDVNYSDLLLILGRFREAVRVAGEGLEHARALGVERTSGAIMRHNMAEPLIQLGEIDRAEALVARISRSDTLRVFRLYGLLSQVRLLAWRGAHEEAGRLLREWRPAVRQTAVVERQVWYSGIEMEVAVAISAGDWDAAAAAIACMLDDDRPALAHRRRLLLEAGWILAEQRANGRDVDALADAVRHDWARLPETLRDATWGAVIDALLRGEVAPLRTAVGLAEDEGVPAVMRAALRLHLARALVAAGDRAAAGATLREAGDVAAMLRHARLQHDVQAFADAGGLATDRGAERSRGDVDLTARERQVLELIAEGLSNRQIGERLYISVKTASVHVSAILRKLSVTSRTEAAVAAARVLDGVEDGERHPAAT